MNFSQSLSKTITAIISLSIWFAFCSLEIPINDPPGLLTATFKKAANNDGGDSLKIVSENLYTLLKIGKYVEAERITNQLERLIDTGQGFTDETIAYPLYLIGFFKMVNEEPIKSFKYFNRALSILEKYPSDSLIGKVNYNLGRASNLIGDDIRSDFYFSRSLNYVIKEKGEKDPELITDYLALSIANINIHNYETAISYTNMGLAIAASRPEAVKTSDIALLYQTKGTALAKISDQYQAIINFSSALKIYEGRSLPVDDYYINLIDNLATVYYNLGNIEKSIETYEKGLRSSRQLNGTTPFNLASNFATVLASTDQKEKAEKVINVALMNLKNEYNTSTREYTYAITEYAGFLREFNINTSASLELFKKSFDYIRLNPWDLNLATNISLGYARALMANNQPETALDSISSLLSREAGIPKPVELLLNPDISLLNTDQRTLNILKAKFDVLHKMAESNRELRFVESEARTAGLIIEIIETIRINIGEEQSRLLLGDKFRDAYLNAISSYLRCYNFSRQEIFLEKAFEYSERSKASSLLASIREMKAMKIYIPAALVSAERKIQEEIGFYTARYDAENNKENPDSAIISLWEESLLNATSKRDSLRQVFKNDYKGFYDIKFNTKVVGTEETKRLIGRNKDFLSYIVSDSLLYILVVNREETHLESIKIDTGFNRLIARYRKLISEPDMNNNARTEFRQFQEYGNRLYSLLIDPVKNYLISNNLIISPDNLLSYFPFETLVTSREIHTDLYYNRLSYLMNDYRIAYAYSATLLSESVPTRPAFKNSTLALAPSYKTPILIDSISIKRQQSEGTLSDLIHAKEEVEFVRDITSGIAYTGKSATKSVYEREAGKYDILHLAMHTVLKKLDPINSGMIFADTDSGTSNRYLHPYEIYNFPIKAKMVVLSSCYTGTGTLYAGEGVLSLARGFIFSGSRSVVMSLWEVDDREGTEIIKAFYKNIKAGKQKSEALRIARLDYLKRADMLRAHPYYWSTLVNYGDDSPLYVSRFMKGILLVLFCLLGVYIYSYLKKR